MASKHLQPELRIVLLGMSGDGKSTAGNIILGKDKFKTDMSSASVTKKCQMEKGEVGEQTLAVVDTPGLFHTTLSREEVMKELLECTALTEPGPHVFLLVLKLGSRSRKYKEMLEAFKKVFQNAKDYTIVLFTHGDKHEQKIEGIEFINESCGAYHVFDKNDKDKPQASDLLEKINSMVQKNEPSYYSNDMFKQAGDAWREIMQSKNVSKEGALEYLGGLILKGRAAVGGKLPGLLGTVVTFLEKLEAVALKCMPPEALQ